ncbi:helix-turn-helix transcriptional regulator [Rhizobium leguminosarum]|uniref:helix-turn-helix transcriptional regulator n=1 Tax=Rhizobium leguminosarum TaxID=384 RepID=UPI00143F43AD|nr:helix-turn-helix transcriptional regulator [Rhizobium leguminosarum]
MAKQHSSQLSNHQQTSTYFPSMIAEVSEPDTAMSDIARSSDFQNYLLMVGSDEGPRTLIASNWQPKLLSAYTNQSLLFRNQFVAKLKGQLLPAIDLQSLIFARENGERASLLTEAARASGISETLGLRVMYSKDIVYTALLSAPKLPAVDFPAILFALVGAINSFGQSGVGSSPSPMLTPRELECLKWIAAGKSSRDVGAILDISAHTVNDYMKSVFSKLGAANRVQAVGIAYRVNLI